MFRDPAYFRALREHVVPLLRTYPSLKVWVAGCSTGEEVYSLAILLHEEGLLERTLIYATDINPQALRKRRGRRSTSLDRIAGFTENYRRAGGTRRAVRLLHAAYGRAVFDRGLRKHVVFSDHSLATDSVFAEVQLVSCRNVLIYFDRGCRTARSACSATRWCTAASSAWAARSRCASAPTPMRSSRWWRRRSSSGSGHEPAAAAAAGDRDRGFRRRGGGGARAAGRVCRPGCPARCWW